MPLTIGVPRETFAGEKRVATVPEVVEKLIKLGFGVCVESGAGAAANFGDEAYQAAGARIAASAADLYGASDMVFKVRAPSSDEIAQGLTCQLSFIALPPSDIFPNLGFRWCEDVP